MKHPPLVRALRTVVQVLVAVAVLAPTLVAVLGVFGVHVDATALVAIIGVAVLVINTAASAIDKAGPVPFLRTTVQVLVALAGVVPAIVAGLAAGGVHVDQAQLAALAAAAVLVVATVQNLLEHHGTVPTFAGRLVTIDDVDRLVRQYVPVGDGRLQLRAELANRAGGQR